MKAKMSLEYSKLKGVIEGHETPIKTALRKQYVFIDGKTTDVLQHVIVTAISESLGEFQLVFPPKESLAEELESKYVFAQPISIPELGEVSDVKISVYNGGLIIKFFMEGLV